jgi:hypothetical protein
MGPVNTRSFLRNHFTVLHALSSCLDYCLCIVLCVRLVGRLGSQDVVGSGEAVALRESSPPWMGQRTLTCAVRRIPS